MALHLHLHLNRLNRQLIRSNRLISSSSSFNAAKIIHQQQQQQQHHYQHQHRYFTTTTATTYSPVISESMLISLSMNVNNSGDSHYELLDNLKRNNLLRTPAIESAMRLVDRADYLLSNTIPTERYTDKPQPIGQLSTISSPHSHCIALESLSTVLKPGARVLDIGSGSGYLSTVMAILVGPTGSVTAIDHSEILIKNSISNTKKSHSALLINNRLKYITADGSNGYSAAAPYDCIHIGAAVNTVSQSLLSQLAINGQLLAPVISSSVGRIGEQTLQLYTRTNNNTDNQSSPPAASAATASIPHRVSTIMSCVYAPMRATAPSIDIDDFHSFDRETDRLESQAELLQSQLKQWAAEWKQTHNSKPSMNEMQLDEIASGLLREYSRLNLLIKKRKQIGNNGSAAATAATTATATAKQQQ